MILKQLFRSTVAGAIRIGFKTPVANPRTPVLLTCRKIHSEDPLERSLSLLPWEFPNTGYMLNQLIYMPRSELSQIRNIRVKGYSFYIATDAGRRTSYEFVSVLALLPGLQLDRLIVEHADWGRLEDNGTRPNPRQVNQRVYDNVCALLQTDGWKEAWFVAPTTSFLTGHRLDNSQISAVQPQLWDKAIKARDGEDSGAECRIYVAKEAGRAGAAEDESTREEW
jgi:hypothetical protein